MKRAVLFLAASLAYAATVVVVANRTAGLLDTLNAATEPARAWLARQDEKAASALGGEDSEFPGDWPHHNACTCGFCYSAAMGGGR